MASDNRPLSPHLGIYRWQNSMTLSILHRATGIALFAGTALVVVWLWSAAYQPSFYPTLHDLLASQLGRLCLIGWTASFYYHLANGIRHLFWDIGQGFTLPVMGRSGWAVVVFTLAATCFTWGSLMMGAH